MQHGRERSRVALGAALVSALGLLVGLVVSVTAGPALGATNTIALNLTCQSSTPIGNIATTQTVGFDITAPDAAQTGSPFDAALVFPADTVSSSQNGGSAHVDYIKNLSYKIPVPANASYAGASLSGGFNDGSAQPTVTLQGTTTTGSVIYSIPGPIPTDQQFQIPALTLHLTATGAEQSFVRLQLGGTSVTDPGFTTTAHVTSPFNGDAATSCYEPAPKTNWNNTQIIAVDTTAPTITLNTPADGAQYPQGAHVAANYTCDDGQFGSGVATCAGDVSNGSPIDTSTLGDFAFTVTAKDNNGNIASPVTHHYSVVPAGNDTVPPQITIGAPANGAVYQQGATVTASYSCLDNESGIASCAGDVGNGSAVDTSTVGAHTFTVNATDAAGNPNAARVGYRVVPAPAPQNFTSGDVTNQVPVACDNQFQTAHKTIAVSTNTAPAIAGEGTQFTWSVALGADFIPSLGNGTNLVYTWKAPANGHFVSAALTGAGSEVNGAAIAVKGDGTLQLTIASVTDQGTLGVGNDAFTPPPFRATIAVDGAAGATVTTQFAEFDVTVTTASLLTTTSHCTGGDPSYNGRANPTLTSTAIVDRTPPTISITSPQPGRVYAPGEGVALTYSCSDDHGTPSCSGTVPSGTALDTSTSGVHQVDVTSTDASGNNARQWVTYTVDDPVASVADTSVVEGPGATLDFAVSLSNPSARVVTINYATSDGTAAAGSDYSASAGAVTFNPGDPLTKLVPVPVVDDSVWKGNRTLTLNLVTAMHATLGRAAATGTIIDDDPPPAAVADATVTEGPSRALDFAVTLAGDPHSPVTVDYTTVDGTAHAPARYAATSGTLTFNPGDVLVQHVLVPVVNDAIYDETTTVNSQAMFLDTTEPANGSLATATGTIVDDEPIPPVVNVGSASIVEGDTGTRSAHVTVTLTRPSTQTVAVHYATAPGTATTSDFGAKSGTLTFTAGQIMKSVAVSIKGDTVPENNETFTIHLSGQSNALMGHADGTVTIVDDDHPTVTTPRIDISDNTLFEGGGGKTSSLTFTVSLNRPAGTPVTVHYTTVAGTATTGSDFVTKTSTLSFTATQLQKTVTIQVKTDYVAEADESFTVVLSSPTGAVLGKSVGTGTILNDD